jgi:undecaprenyl-diphosphatase
VAKLAVAVIAAAGVAVLSVFFDRRLAFFALTLSPSVVMVGQKVSDIGTSGYMFALSGLIAVGALAVRSIVADGRHDEALTALVERALYIFATLATAGLAAQAIKHLVGRARPRYVQIFGPYHFDILSMKNSLASFPSGHAATAFSMAVALSYLMPRARPALLALATAIALSRIVVEAHFASDIVVGGGLGIGTAMLVARWLADRDFAFTRRDGAVRVKSPGAIIAALRGRSLAS